MPKLHDLRPVDVDYATTGPNQNTLRERISKPADALFRCLEDAAAWKEWLGIDVEWTSERPFGVGTTRTVKASGQTIDEYFLAWEEGRRMCFRFDRSTMPVTAFAEDYVITPLGDKACELAWSTAFEMRGPAAAVTAKVFGAGFAFNSKRGLTKLSELMASTDRYDA